MLRMDGFDEVQRNLEKLQQKAQELDGDHEVPLSKLMPDSFIRSHTSFSTLQALTDASGIQSVAEVGSAEWETFIAGNTQFASWEEMQQSALADYVKRQLGFS